MEQARMVRDLEQEEVRVAVDLTAQREIPDAARVRVRAEDKVKVEGRARAEVKDKVEVRARAEVKAGDNFYKRIKGGIDYAWI